MIRSMSWDAAGRMSQVVDHNKNGTGRKVTSYRYDYNGNLALEIKEQGQTSFVNPWVTVRNGTIGSSLRPPAPSSPPLPPPWSSCGLPATGPPAVSARRWGPVPAT